MTAATILRQVQTADAGHEVVVLTVTDGETYISKKFGKIIAAAISSNYDASGNPAHVTFSTNTATIAWGSQTDKTATLELWGHEA